MKKVEIFKQYWKMLKVMIHWINTIGDIENEVDAYASFQAEIKTFEKKLAVYRNEKGRI